MAEADATARELTHAAAEGLDEVFEVFADIIAPLIGVIVGWIAGPTIGGPGMVGQMVYSVLKNTAASAANATKIADAVGGIVFGGVYGGLGAALWSCSDRFKSKKKWGSMVARAALRFGAGFGFGLALWSVIAGLTGQVTNGYFEQLASGLSKEA